MDLRSLSSFELPPTADFHVHLRDGEMAELITPTIKDGGVDVVFVMPNLTPPVTSVEAAVSYHKKISSFAPDVTFLMSLFLHPSLTPEIIAESARSKIIYGVKLYPAGVTTNSTNGVLDIKQYYPIFEAMQANNLVLNLHGEAVFSSADITVYNAEPKFLPQLHKLHAAFPKLRIILEHVSTKAGLEAIRECGPTVAGTITAHHLWVTTEEAEQDCFNFCKPLAKTLDDRIALVQAVVEGSPKFFFGSDSAPHPAKSKKEDHAAGCFTQGWCTPLVLGALEEGLNKGWITEKQVTRESIEGFLSKHGRAFYQLPESQKPRIRLERRGETIPKLIASKDGSIEVVPFRSGKEILSLSWIN